MRPIRILAALGLVLAVALAALASSRPFRLALAKRLRLPVSVETVYPGVPWTGVVPQLPPVQGVEGVRATDCGKCHVRHYEEWRRSTHANAYTDLQFQSELGKAGQPRWLCLNCHIPVENQRDERVTELRGGELDSPIIQKNPGFDPAMRDEGVTCAACHVRRDESGKSYIIGSIGGTTPPHPVRIDREALVRRCDDCHDQTYQLTPALTCYFQSGRELAAGPYAGEKQCVSCHMPPVERPLVSLDGAISRTAHMHGFIGGGVPKQFDLIDAQPELGYRPALDIDYNWTASEPDSFEIAIRLNNARAGHKVPTGDPERYLIVSAALLDEKGNEIAGERWRIGQVWEWAPVARQVSDNRIGPREERVLKTRLRPGAGQAARIRVEARHVRLSPENLEYMKKTAKDADPRFAPAIAEMDRRYPTERVFYSREVALPR